MPSRHRAYPGGSAPGGSSAEHARDAPPAGGWIRGWWRVYLVTLTADAATVETGLAAQSAPRTDLAVFWSDLPPKERTLLDILGVTAARYPHATASDDGQTTLTY